mmetsp:Transcript_43771/g.85912  ORF Transcript_43771/g.85912 Transcript_43771/m.85912 type:complete len:86 (+) Transcript_43771:481-738(+)
MDHTTRVLTFTSSTTDTTSHDNISLLGFETKTASLFGSGRTDATGNLRMLAILPSTDTEEKANNITLFVTPELFHILISTHFKSI